MLATGEADFALFWRTLPWDHAPGVLLAEEAGCYVARPSEITYQPLTSGEGLLVARDESTWTALREQLLPNP